MKTTYNFRQYMRTISVLLAVAAMLSLSGCATFGPKYSTMKNKIAELPKEKGRIVFYRPDAIFGHGFQPDILLNGKLIGISRSGTIFYVDVDSGMYRVTVPAVLYSGETTIDIGVPKNKTVYVKSYLSGSAFAGKTKVEVISSEQAITEINDLEFMANPTK